MLVNHFVYRRADVAVFFLLSCSAVLLAQGLKWAPFGSQEMPPTKHLWKNGSIKSYIV